MSDKEDDRSAKFSVHAGEMKVKLADEATRKRMLEAQRERQAQEAALAQLGKDD